MCAYYKAFSAIYPGPELRPILSAWALFRHDNTTTTSQHGFETTSTEEATTIQVDY